MEGQQHNNPLTCVAFFTMAQKGWSWLLTHAIVETAKTLGHTNESKSTNEHTKHKYTKEHLAQLGCMNWSW